MRANLFVGQWHFGGDATRTPDDCKDAYGDEVEKGDVRKVALKKPAKNVLIDTNRRLTEQTKDKNRWTPHELIYPRLTPLQTANEIFAEALTNPDKDTDTDTDTDNIEEYKTQ